MVKQLHTTQSLLIALDLCQPSYQNFLIIYLKFIAKNVDIKTVNLSVSLKGLKLTNLQKITKIINKLNCKECTKIKTNKWIN